MSPPSLLQRLKLRHKIAALGVVGMGLLVLPLVQWFHFQGLELQWAMAERERAEPALLAVNLQRALVDHALAASQVLNGQRQLDGLRRSHQATVDARLAVLAHHLEQGPHRPAQREVQAMRGDWLDLVQRVVTRRCTVRESEQGHRLLVEQTLQVIDIVSTAASAPAPAGMATDARLAALQSDLPRALARTLALAAADGLSPTAARTTAAQAVALAIGTQLDAARQAQGRRVAWHQAQRALAGGGLLMLVLGIAGGLAWLRRSLVLAGRAGGQAADTSLAAPPTDRATSVPGPTGAPASDGQQAGRRAQASLLQRLRGNSQRQAPPTRPAMDEPTQPQDL